MKSYESTRGKFVILHKPFFQKPFFSYLWAINSFELLFLVTFDASIKTIFPIHPLPVSPSLFFHFQQK